MSQTRNPIYSLPATDSEFAADAVVVTDVYRTALGHFARITDRQAVAYVIRHHDGQYDHLDSGACPVHLDAAASSRREIAVAEKIAQVSR